MSLKFQNLFNKFLLIICLFLTCLVIYLKEKEVSSIKFNNKSIKNYKTLVADYSINDVKKIFPDAVRFEKTKDGVINAFDSSNQKIGLLLNSSPYSNNIYGYSARVPLLIGMDENLIIKGIGLLENYETKEAVEAIEKKGFLQQWKQQDIHNLDELSIDAVSSATFTSDAIIKGVNTRIAAFLNKTPVKSTNYNKILKYAVAILLLLFAFLSGLFKKILGKYRVFLLSANVIVFGFWLGSSLSLQLFHNWITYGVFLKVHFFLFTVFIISIIFPIFFNKAIYCSYICPFGSCQELCGNLNKRWKINVPRRISSTLKTVPYLFLISVAFLLFIDFKINLFLVEPFFAFNFKSASFITIIIALIIITLSFLIQKPWCNYLCPTGRLLELIKKNKEEL